jgi:hypothetical protein
MNVALQRAQTLAKISYKSTSEIPVPPAEQSIDNKLISFFHNFSNQDQRSAYAEIIQYTDERYGQFSSITKLYYTRERIPEGVRVEFSDGEIANFRINHVRLYLLNLQNDPIDFDEYLNCFRQEIMALQSSSENNHHSQMTEPQRMPVHVIQQTTKGAECIAYASFDKADYVM